MLAHPGYSATNLQTTGPTGVAKAVMTITNRVLAQSAERGALPTLYAATAPGVEGGSYYGPDGIAEMRGFPQRVEAIPRAHDPETGKRLWEVSIALTGVHPPLRPAPCAKRPPRPSPAAQRPVATITLNRPEALDTIVPPMRVGPRDHPGPATERSNPRATSGRRLTMPIRVSKSAHRSRTARFNRTAGRNRGATALS